MTRTLPHATEHGDSTRHRYECFMGWLSTETNQTTCSGGWSTDRTGDAKQERAGSKGRNSSVAAGGAALAEMGIEKDPEVKIAHAVV
jgi:hypothetical protein